MPIILISRGTMSGVRLLVKSLTEHLGYRSVSREDLIARVNEHGEIANRIVEHLGKATRAYDQFSQLRRSYVILMRMALLEYIREDNLVYHGYSGHLLVAPMQHFLRVRINAPLPLRVQMTMDRLGCIEQAARDHILTQDEERGRWARFMYGRDIRDPGLYDVVVNLNRMPMHAVCMMLQAVAEEPQFATTPQTRQAVETLLLTTQIEAAIATDPRTSALDVVAEADDKRVKLIGPWLEHKQCDEVLEIAARVAGARELTYDSGYAPITEIPIETR